MGHTLDAEAFYSAMLQTLHGQRVPFLIGGAYGFAHLTGIRRPTKDLDIFIRQRDWQRVAQAALGAGYQAELAYPHWLGKIHGDGGFADVIFNSGNGLCPVDEAWFEHAIDAQLFGHAVKLAPVEESIWSKGFIMERERFDGADVAHLIHACALGMDWERLLLRFGPHWRVLMSHLVLFGFIYPGARALVPRWLMDELNERLRMETHAQPPRTERCAGTLLSREQYLPDVSQQGYEDVRLAPHGTMTVTDVAGWTAAIGTPTPEPNRNSADG
jgi:hypothetical protein